MKSLIYKSVAVLSASICFMGSANAKEVCNIETETSLSIEANSTVADVSGAAEFYKNTENKIYSIAEGLGVSKESLRLDSKDLSVDRGYYSDIGPVEIYDISATYHYYMQDMDLAIKMVKALSSQGLGTEMNFDETNNCEEVDVN